MKVLHRSGRTLRARRLEHLEQGGSKGSSQAEGTSYSKRSEKLTANDGGLGELPEQREKDREGRGEGKKKLL